MTAVRLLPVLWWGACVVLPQDDSARDTDTDVAPDSPGPTDTPEVPDETDTDTDTDGDSDVPTSPWGPGFTDLSGPLLGAFPVLQGAREPFQSPQSTYMMAVDLDGDDDLELWTGSVLLGMPAGTVPQTRVYHWTATGLVRDEALEAAVGADRHQPQHVVDLDQDGWVDLIGPSPARAVRWGTGAGVWGDWVDLSADTDATDLTRSAVALMDLDDDGWLDLVYGGWDCREEPVALLRTGPRAFDSRALRLSDTGVGIAPVAVLGARLEGGIPFVYVVHDLTCGSAPLHPGFLRRTG